MKTSATTSLVLGLSLFSAAFGQFWAGPLNRPHPLHGRNTNNDFNTMLAMASLFGMEVSDLLLMNTLAGGGGGGFMMAPIRPQQQRLFQRNLSLLGYLDGADMPDPVAPAGRQGGRAGGRAGGRGGGEGGGRAEEAVGRRQGGAAKGGNRRRANKRRGGAGAGAGPKRRAQ